MRESFPNWVVLPEEQRSELWINTEYFAKNEDIFKFLTEFTDLEYIYELNWRLEKCLFPIYNSIAPLFQNILNKYNPFNKDLSHLSGQFISFENPNYVVIKNQWLEVTISLLRFYREEAFQDRWNETSLLLNLIKKSLTPEQSAKFHYEQCLRAVYNQDYLEINKQLQEWPINESLPFWEAKRAGLLAEIGQEKDAEIILEKALFFIRKRQNLSPVTNDYTWLSQEAYTMLLHQIIHYRVAAQSAQFTPFLHNEDYRDRWDLLLQYKCDPFYEFKYFNMVLQKPFELPSAKIIKPTFDIGSVTTTYISGGSNQGYFEAYTFFRFIEEVGMPLGLGSVCCSPKTVTGAVERIIKQSPAWATSVMMRFGDKKSIEDVLSRKIVNDYDVSTVDSHINVFLNNFKKLHFQLKTNPMAMSIVNIAAEFLSRMSVKCSEEVREKLYNFVKYVYSNRIPLNNMHHLMRRLINSSNWDFQYKMLPILIDIPILEESNNNVSFFFEEPFYYLQLHNYKPTSTIEIKISSVELVFEQAQKSESQRARAIARLVLLYALNLLNEDQTNRLTAIIWSKTNESTGFPMGTRFFNFGFITFPTIGNIDSKKLFRKYILTGSFEKENLNNNKGVAMSDGESRYSSELLGGSATFFNKKGIAWNVDEISCIWLKCIEWWNEDKHFLINEIYKKDSFGGSINEEFKQRFSNLVRIISRLFGYQRYVVEASGILTQLQDLILEMSHYNIPTMQAKAAFVDIFYKNTKDYLDELIRYMASENHDVVFDAISSTILISEQMANSTEYISFNDSIVDVLLQPVIWRVRNVMDSALDALINFVRSEKTLDEEKLVSHLTGVLDYLIWRTDISNEESDFSIDDKLIYRKKGIKLASVLFNYFENKKISLPEIVKNWQNVSLDNNEFTDITSQWNIENI